MTGEADEPTGSADSEGFDNATTGEAARRSAEPNEPNETQGSAPATVDVDGDAFDNATTGERRIASAETDETSGQPMAAGAGETFDNAATVERRTMSPEEAAVLVGEADRRASAEASGVKRAPAVVRTNEAQPIPLVRPAIDQASDADKTDEIVAEEADLGVRRSHGPTRPSKATERVSSRLPSISVDATQEVAPGDVLKSLELAIVDEEVDAFVVAPPRVSKPRAFDTQQIRQMDRDHLSMLTTGEITLRKKRGGVVVAVVVGVALAILGMVAVAAMLALDDNGGHRVTNGESHKFVAPLFSLDVTPRQARASSGGAKAGSVSLDALPHSAAH